MNFSRIFFVVIAGLASVSCMKGPSSMMGLTPDLQSAGTVFAVSERPQVEEKIIVGSATPF